jgi:hypothetical protein
MAGVFWVWVQTVLMRPHYRSLQSGRGGGPGWNLALPGKASIHSQPLLPAVDSCGLSLGGIEE